MRAVDDLLAAARAGGGHLLLVEGHAGIGKTALLDAAVERARAAGATVMRARGSVLEADFAFGIALQLFEPLLAGADDETHDRLLAGSAALAGPLLERPTSWGGEEGDDRAYSVIHGLFWLLSNLAETGPVLIVVDDAHWADRTSLRLVLYLLQRVGEMRVAIVAARRLGEPGAPDDLLGQIAAHPASRGVRPQALSQEGGAHVRRPRAARRRGRLRRRLLADDRGQRIPARRARARGRGEGWEPTRTNAARIGTLAPEAVLRAVAVRLMRLSDDAAGVARAVAVLGDDAQLRHVAQLTGREPERVAAAADALAAGEILRPAGRGVLRFAHPLLASAVYADVGTGERAALHRRAAEILHDDETAPVRVAAHLLPSPGTGEQWVVDVLCAAADRALSIGAPESASSYLRRALEEPPTPAARAAVLRQLGHCEAATDLPAGLERLEQALDAAIDDRERASTLLVIGRARSCNGEHTAAREAFDEAAAIVGADPDVAAQAGAEAVALGLLDPAGRALLSGSDARTAAAGASAGEPVAQQRMLLATQCLREAIDGDSREAVLDLALRAQDGDDRLADPGGSTVLAGVSIALRACDELAWNDRMLTVALSRSRARGSMMAFATASLLRGASRWRQGRLDEAIDDAEQAVGAERYGWRQFLPAAYGTLVGLHIDRGEFDAAADWAARLDASEHAGSALMAPWHAALGHLALVSRQDADALEHFGAWRDSVAGIRNPAVFAGWRSAMARALTGLGRAQEAGALAAEELELARRFGAPRTIAVSLRELAHAGTHGDLAGDLAGPIALLTEAVEITDASEARLEHCRCLLELGTVLRRAGRRTDAGRALGEALELARACGARLLQERARAELEVAGTRVQRAARRGADALSPSERRVVALAIEGLSNRQIAEALFVTRKAVEWHLGNAYRKLDVRSRGELAGALGAPTSQS